MSNYFMTEEICVIEKQYSLFIYTQKRLKDVNSMFRIQFT